MKVYEEVVIPAYIGQKCVGRTCDLCGKRAARGVLWAASNYETDETTVSVEISNRVGSSYPDMGSGTTYEVDLCPDCFRGTLIPWLRSRGANIEEVEWDY